MVIFHTVTSRGGMVIFHTAISKAIYLSRWGSMAKLSMQMVTCIPGLLKTSYLTATVCIKMRTAASIKACGNTANEPVTESSPTRTVSEIAEIGVTKNATISSLICHFATLGSVAVLSPTRWLRFQACIHIHILTSAWQH